MSGRDYPHLESRDGTLIEIKELPVVIGRANDCQVAVNDNSVSRRHAQITESDGGYFLEDLGSRNGTLLNHTRIHQRTRMRSGDLIQICDSSFVFRNLTGSNTGSGRSSILYDEPESGLSSIMSRLEVHSGSHRSTIDGDRKLEMLMHITRSLNHSLRLDETLQDVIVYLFQLFEKADRGVIVLLDQDGKAIPMATMVRDTNLDSQIQVSNSILEYVMGNREAVLSNDLFMDDRIDTDHSLANVPIRSVMSVPLIDSNDTAIGMIQLDTTHRQRAFDTSDLELLTNVSIQLGMAIENSRLVEQLLASKLVTQELETARKVQESLLPESEPQVDGYSFHHFYRPMIQIGGDYYDYLRLDDDRLAIIVGDVVGHGIPAALLMAKLASECRMALQSRETLPTIAHRLNESFSRLPPDQYATLILTILDHRKHKLEVMNAGHLPPVLRHPNGKVVEPCAVRNFAIGLFADEEIKGGIEFCSCEIDLQPGEVVFLHTDGLNEAKNEAREEYSRQRIHQQAAFDHCLDPRAAIDHLIKDVEEHTGKVSQEDDICIVAFRRDA